jgi:excisionase family DNA binding protein
MARYYCRRCGQETEHVNVSEAAKRVQVTRPTISHWIKKGWLHCWRRAGGRVFICVASLLQDWSDES